MSAISFISDCIGVMVGLCLYDWIRNKFFPRTLTVVTDTSGVPITVAYYFTQAETLDFSNKGCTLHKVTLKR